MSAVERESPKTAAGVAAPGRTPAAEGDGTPEGRTGDLRAEIARALVARFSPHHLDPEYRAERRGLPEPVNDSTMVTFTASDGYLAMRPLTFGEIADALIAAGYRLVSEDEATVERVARAMFEGEFPKSSWDDGAGRAGQEVWRGWARAAVRALREGGAS